MNSAYDTDDRYLPDTDAVDIRIGCERDSEAELSFHSRNLSSNGTLRESNDSGDAHIACPMCGGSGEYGFDRNGSHAAGEYVAEVCPTCHGEGSV